MRKPRNIKRRPIENSERSTELVMNNSNYKIIHPKEIQVGIDDVFGHKECKKELKSLLHFLKEPQKYYNIGVMPYTKYWIITLKPEAISLR